jgi:hypothetical protein
MASITLTIGTFTTTKTIPPADLTRLLTAMKTHYGQVVENGVPRDRTNQELFDLWAAGTLQALRDIAKRVEQEAAKATAAAGVADISLT